MRYFLAIALLVFAIGCGYKPTSKIVDNILDDSVWVDVVMSKFDPQNTVAIKDAVREGIVQRVGRELAPKDEAKTFIIASIKKVSFNPLIYDTYGYVTTYRVHLTLEFKTKFKDGSISNITTVGDNDFRVTLLVKNRHDTSSVISDKDRYNAIKFAAEEAFNEYVSRLAIIGYKADVASKIPAK